MNIMSWKTVLKNIKIASKRVHVEQIIGSAKTYKFLCNPINHTESLMATDICVLHVGKFKKMHSTNRCLDFRVILFQSAQAQCLYATWDEVDSFTFCIRIS